MAKLVENVVISKRGFSKSLLLEWQYYPPRPFLVPHSHELYRLFLSEPHQILSEREQ